MTILVTGCNGMIGSALVKELLKSGFSVIGLDRTEYEKSGITCGKADSDIIRHTYENRGYGGFSYYQVDLEDRKKLERILCDYSVDRIIHLAALAHTKGEHDLSWDRYYHVNVECSRNIFECAGSIPVLYISTIDVYGFFNGKNNVTAATPIHPVSRYGKSKALAEEECMKLSYYTIFRFSPIYTDTEKRDIQKRYYLKYPHFAYLIGKGSSYEILNINLAVEEMIKWCRTTPVNEIRIIKDPSPMWTPDYIWDEKSKGRARIVVRLPRWMVNCGYIIIKGIWGKNEKTYLLNKAVHPLRTEN